MKLAAAFIALAMALVEAIEPEHREPQHHHTPLDGEWTLDCQKNLGQYGLQAIGLIEARFHGHVNDKVHHTHCFLGLVVTSVRAGVCCSVPWNWKVF